MAGTNFNIGVNDNDVVSRLDRIINKVESMGQVSKTVGKELYEALGTLKDTGSIQKAWEALDGAIKDNAKSISTLTEEVKEYRRLAREAEGNLSFKEAREYEKMANAAERLLGFRKEMTNVLDETNQKLADQAQKVENAENKQKSFRTELMETTNEYRQMVRAMQNGEAVDPKRLEEVKQKWLELKGAVRKMNAETSILNSANPALTATIHAIQGVTGAFSVAQGVMGLFSSKSEDLQRIMLRVQSLMSVMMGLQQVQNTLLAKNAILTNTLGKIQTWWTGVMARATVAQAAQNTAEEAGAVATTALGKAFRGLGLAIKAIPGIGWLIAGITALVAVVRTLTEESRKAKQMQEDLFKGVVQEIAKPIARIEELTYSYKQLRTEAAKLDFIQKHAKDFQELGVAINSVADAERLLANGAERWKKAEILKGIATAARKELEENFSKVLHAQHDIENYDPTMMFGSIPGVNAVEGLYKSGKLLSNVKTVKGGDAMAQYLLGLIDIADKAQQTILKEFQNGANKEEGIIEGLEKKIAEYQEKKKKATSVDDIKLYDEQIRIYQNQLDKYNAKRSGSGTKPTKDPTEEAVQRLNKQLELVKQIRDFYEQYADLIDDRDGALEKVKELFGDITGLPEGLDMAAAATGDYVKVLEAFKKQLEAIGGDKAKEAVATIDETIRAFKEGQALDAAKAKQSLDKIFEEWSSHDFSTDKDNAFFGGMGKVLAEMGKGLDELANKVNAQVETLMAARSTMTEKEYNDAYEKLQLFYQKEREKIKENAKYRLSQLGDTISDDILKKFSKTFEQASKVGIKAMKKELEAMKSVAGKDFGFFSEDDKTLLKGLLGMSENDDLWANLGDVAEETLEKVLKTDNLQPEQKALIQALHGLAKEGESLQPILDAIKDKLGTGVAQGQATVNGVSAESVQQYAAWAGRLGQAIGGRTGAGIGALAGAAGNIAGSWGKLKSGDTAAGVAMIVEGAVQMYDMFVSQAKANKQVMKDWEAACKQAAQATRIYAIEQLKYKPSNVWGIESPFKKLEDSGKMYDEAFKQLQDVSRQIAESGKLAKGIKKKVSEENVMKGAAAGAAIGVGSAALIGAAMGSAVGPIGAAIGAAVGAIAGAIAGLFAKKKTKKYKNLTDVYGDIYDPETFELNQDILNDYEKMDDATKQLIDNWDEIKEKMKEAEEEMENTIADLTGDINGMLYDSLIKAFDNDDLYGAMQDIENYFSEMLKRMAVQSLIAGIWEDAAKKLQEGAKQSFFAGGDGSLIDDIMDFFDYTKEVFPVAVDAMAGIKDGLEKAGLKWDTSGATSGSTGGYTTQMSHEDASEINGRMTDIQMQIRLIQGNIVQIVSLQQETRGFARMQADYLYDIKRYTATLPVISEYAKKIATNTANL